MSRVILDQPEPRPGRVPRGGAITPAGALRAWMDRRAAGEPADDAEPVTVPDDEPEQVDDEPAETLEAGLNHTGGQLYGVSAEELARMRASQAAYAAKKVAYMRAVRER